MLHPQLVFKMMFILGPAVGSGLYQLGGFTLPFLTVGIWCSLATIALLLILPNVNKNIDIISQNRNEIDFSALAKVCNFYENDCLFYF